jgi:hypothetical protein
LGAVDDFEHVLKERLATAQEESANGIVDGSKAKRRELSPCRRKRKWTLNSLLAEARLINIVMLLSV